MFHEIAGPAMFIEVTDQGAEGGPVKKTLAAEDIETVYLGNETIVPSIKLRDGSEIYIAEDLAEAAGRLREAGVAVVPWRS